MPVPHISTNFSDLLDPRFQRIYYNQYDQLPDMLPMLFDFPPTNSRDTMTWSEVGMIADWNQFNGTVQYASQSLGYDTTSTPLEWVSGIQVERKLYDDDQYNIMNQRPQGLAISSNRTRQKHGARLLNNSFAVDNFFYNNTEGVALCSNSHTTTSPGVSTASGFDNLGTSALSAVALAAARIQMVGYRDDVGGRISVVPSELWIPNNLYEIAFEIVQSRGKLDVANNNRNVHEGAYTIYEWNYLNDTNNWWVMDGSLKKQFFHWVERVSQEFAMVEDFDKLIAKWRGYQRYSNAWTDWRAIFGANVS
jgi:hypothetical protein